MQMHTDREVLGWRSAADIGVRHWLSESVLQADNQQAANAYY